MKNPIYLSTRLIAFSLLAQLALSWPLWHPGYRTLFPVLPVFDLPFPSAAVWIGTQAWITVGCTLLLWWMPQRRWVLGATAVWYLWMIAQDINRLQPWMYFYLLAFGLILFHSSSKWPDAQKNTPESVGQPSSPTALRWLLAAVYAWGGFNKLTPYFAEDNFPWFCEAFVWTKPLAGWPEAGYGVALLELLFAPGLLWAVSRPVFRWLVPVFHVFIIFALSPLGLDWNTVVIPWNLAMAGMVWVLFQPNRPGDDIRPSLGETPPLSMLQTLILALAWVMPVFNIFHRWDEPLSWKMYSNTQTEATFYTQKIIPKTIEWEALWAQHAYDDGQKLLLDDWAFRELHVPLYNSRRTFMQTARYLCGNTAGNNADGLLLLTVDRWDKSAEKWDTIPCAQIVR